MSIFTRKSTVTEMLEITVGTVTKRYCSAVLPKQYLGLIYEPLVFQHDPITLSQESTSGNLKLKVSAIFKGRKPFIDLSRDVWVKLFLVKDNVYYKTIFDGYVATATISLNDLTITANQITAGTSLTIPNKMYSGNCQNGLYGIDCKVNKDTWKATGYIAEIDTAKRVRLVFTGGNMGVSGMLELGALRNVRTNEQFMIKQNESGGWATLVQRFTDLIEGDAFEFWPGCDKQRLGHCRNRFNNEINFFGCDRTPGQNPFKDPLK